MRKGKQSSVVQMSKKLSWALRHGAAKIGLPMSAAGYVKVSDLLRNPEFKSFNLKSI